MTTEPTEVRSVLLVSHTAREEAIKATAQVAKMLKSAGVSSVMTAENRKEFEAHIDVSEISLLGDPNDVEIAVVLGGDGTILRAAEIVRGSDCPIVGVNLGHVGFLAELESHNLEIMVSAVLERNYTVEERVALDVKAFKDDHVIADTWALNEATVEKHSRMIEVVIGVDGRPVSSFGCDGVVMATPTGSTAYAFSAGGPIVWPGVQAMLMVPIAAHALFDKPLVVGPESVLSVQIETSSVSDGELWCDGRRHFDLPLGSIVEVRRSQLPVRLARIDEGVFTERLVRKFDLPVAGWRGGRKAAD